MAKLSVGPPLPSLELTKHFSVCRAALADWRRSCRHHQGRSSDPRRRRADTAPAAADWQAALAAALEDQPLRAAVDEITGAYGLKRKDVYDAALALKAEKS